MVRTSLWLAMACVGAAAAGQAMAGGPATKGTWLSAVAPASAPASEPAEWEKPGCLKALSFTLEYTLVTDYVWRGINLSEHPGEGREKLNHQLGWGFEVDPSQWGTANIGRFGGIIWFEWFAGQERLTPWSGNNLQEVDYTVYWAYDIEAIGLGVEVGWLAYTFPRLRDRRSSTAGDLAYTHEVCLTLTYDDSRLFGQPLLNPTVSYYQDVDDVQAGFLILGISHDFALGDCWKDAAVLKDITVTPSLALGVDHRYYDKAGLGSDSAIGTRLGYLEYGLAVAYDLSGALGIPPQCGALTLTGFLNFAQVLHNESPLVHDELYGGMKLGWEW